MPELVIDNEKTAEDIINKFKNAKTRRQVRFLENEVNIILKQFEDYGIIDMSNKFKYQFAKLICLTDKESREKLLKDRDWFFRSQKCLYSLNNTLWVQFFSVF